MQTRPRSSTISERTELADVGDQIPHLLRQNVRMRLRMNYDIERGLRKWGFVAKSMLLCSWAHLEMVLSVK